MKRILLILTLSIPFFCFADIDTDRAMAKIILDSQTYLSADARDSSEEAAYDKAASELLDAINNYYSDINMHDKKISNVSGLSEICSKLTSKISDSRYRVLLYVKKSTLVEGKKTHPAEAAPAVKPTLQNPVTKEIPLTQEKTSPKKSSPSSIPPTNPTLTKISKLQTKSEVVETIKSLHKSKQLSGGASFPVGNANDFYVVVIDDDKVIITLHYKDGQYFDTKHFNIIDITKYSNCTGYWFTLPNTK